jgi:hypothetical protein
MADTVAGLAYWASVSKEVAKRLADRMDLNRSAQSFGVILSGPDVPADFGQSMAHRIYIPGTPSGHRAYSARFGDSA